MNCPSCNGRGYHVEGISRKRGVVRSDCPDCFRGNVHSNKDLAKLIGVANKKLDDLIDLLVKVLETK